MQRITLLKAEHLPCAICQRATTLPRNPREVESQENGREGLTKKNEVEVSPTFCVPGGNEH